MFDYMAGNRKRPKVRTIKKLCAGVNITLEQFFSRDYFNSMEDVYKFLFVVIKLMVWI